MTKPLRTWWHELNTWEPDAARAFYGRTLGWEFEKVALPDAAEYWIARKEGKPVGGVFALSEPDYAGIPSHWMTYMAVADIGQAERATAVVTDAAGAMIGLIEPDPYHALSETAA